MRELPAATDKARAGRLWKPRRSLLQRGALHRHDHSPLSDEEVVDMTDQYVAGVTGEEQLIIELLETTPWQRQVAVAVLAVLDAETPGYKMGHRARIDDIGHQLETTAQ